MITQSKILSELIGLVGWRQSTAVGEVVVDATNLASSSGLYVQDAHPLATVKYIKAAQEDKLTITDEQVNTLLTNIMKSGAASVLNYVFPGNDVFANNLLYKYKSDFSTPITGLSGFVGFEISIAQKEDIVSILNKVFLQFDGSGSVKLLLFNSGSNLPLETKTITVTANTNIESVLDWVLGYITAPGGTYYLGYLNTGMTINAIDRTFGDANVMSRFNSIVFKPIYVADWNAETLFDINDIVYRSESFGMNFDVTTARDYSSIVLQNKDRFAKAIQLAAAGEALTVQTSTARIIPEDRTIINVFDQKTVIDSPATYNLYTKLEREMKSLLRIVNKHPITSETIR